MSTSPTETYPPPPRLLASHEELPNGHPPSSERPVTTEAQIGLPDILKPRYFFGWEGGALPT